MKLGELITAVTKEGRLSEHDAMKIISEMADNEEKFTPMCIYRAVYSKAYGETVSKELAMMIVRQMAVTDGSERVDGEKWNIENTTQVGNDIGIDWNKISKVDFYFVMNMVYSDFYNFATKLEFQDDAKFYAYMAKDWLCDVDVPNKKLYKYIFNVLM